MSFTPLKISLFILCATALALPVGNLFSVKVKDLDQKEFALDQLKKNTASVLVFLAPDCPLCQNYALTLNKQYEKYKAKKVNYYGIVSGKLYTQQEINHYKKLFNIKFPILIDDSYQLKKILNASVVPEVFLVDKSGKTKYSGRIDDWAYEIGKHKTAATEHNLNDAVNALLAGKPIKTSKTKAVGCILE